MAIVLMTTRPGPVVIVHAWPVASRMQTYMARDVKVDSAIVTMLTVVESHPLSSCADTRMSLR
jgi:hypothetical protein